MREGVWRRVERGVWRGVARAAVGSVPNSTLTEVGEDARLVDMVEVAKVRHHPRVLEVEALYRDHAHAACRRRREGN